MVQYIAQKNSRTNVSIKTLQFLYRLSDWFKRTLLCLGHRYAHAYARTCVDAPDNRNKLSPELF